ncbi:DUF3833 domain-containing protein [Photobacterium atrarenae]|uniref:DUF3833 domain-containing protein n=1 Tax=Photobacterium atrarenae TaxID=865757 RepID=A0ABY5GL69_9GAMM|nr:DUF3833 domain-containing protein [Photobacterium atrarenae]UTV30065.1 DUF3833 domain-containing protein [Photobacterium atrarenae]
MQWKIVKAWVVLIGLLSFIGLPGCSSSIEDYRGTSPDFQLYDYFDGQVKAWGMLQDWQGTLTRRFEVDIRGVVAGDQLTLYEDFRFDDGEEQQRTWVIHRGLDSGQYVGRAGDVIGEATGQSVGHALRWQYVLRVPVGETTYDISIDDWMYRQDNLRVFNRATMKKWGVTVGTITLFFEKQTSDSDQ